MKVRVHLATGEVIESADDQEVTSAQVEEFKAGLREAMSNSGEWQVNVELLSGDWAIVPKHAVLYVEVAK